MYAINTAIACAAIWLSVSAMAQEQTPNEHRLADHPAVTVKRLSEDKGYDYASKFYPHPAGLRLYRASPDEIAVGEAKRQVAEAESAANAASSRR